MGLKPIGFDISQRMVNSTEINLKHFRIRNFKVAKADALKIKGRFDAIVTDPPYGRNTNVKDLKSLYQKFLRNAKNLTSKMVLIIPSNIDYKLLTHDWTIIAEELYFIHASLSKRIIVLETEE